VIFKDEPGIATGSSSDYYRLDSVGLYLAVVPAESATSRVVARDLVTTQVWPTILQWPRGERMLVSGGPVREPSPQVFARRRLYIVDASTGAAHQAGADNPARFRPALSPSGQALGYLELAYLTEARGVPFFSMRLAEIRQPDSIVDLSPRRDMDGLDPLLPPVWADERTLYVGRYVNATARLYRIDLDSRQWRQVTPDTLSVAAYATASDGKVLLAVLENANHRQELYRVEPRTGALTRLTDETGSQPALDQGRVEQVQWLGLDGRFTVHGFLLKPPGYDPRRRYPLIVMIHGGPGSTYPNRFRDIHLAWGSMPPQLLAASGYLVLLPNPRGDWSYGVGYRDAILGDHGPGPLADVMGGVADLIHRGLADSSAVGVYGASYGAYLAAYAITQSHRFVAAVIDDGPMNLTSFYGQTYAINSPLLKRFMIGSPWRKASEYIAQSPITHVGQVRTPVLMRYGGRSVTGDNVRPSYMLAQGLEFYAGLKDHGVLVEFIIHPDQGHTVDDWELFEDYCRRILRWFDRWLVPEVSRLPAKSIDVPTN
jgi:dipeptidyl aminopeptidase/acylaminoacyl peptidase